RGRWTGRPWVPAARSRWRLIVGGRNPSLSAIVPNAARPASVGLFLSNSFGFGRHERRCGRTDAPWPLICLHQPEPRGDALIVEKKHTDNFTILYVEGMIKLGESAEFFSDALENVLKNESTNVINVYPINDFYVS